MSTCGAVSVRAGSCKQGSSAPKLQSAANLCEACRCRQQTATSGHRWSNRLCCSCSCHPPVCRARGACPWTPEHHPPAPPPPRASCDAAAAATRGALQEGRKGRTFVIVGWLQLASQQSCWQFRSASWSGWSHACSARMHACPPQCMHACMRAALVSMHALQAPSHTSNPLTAGLSNGHGRQKVVLLRHVRGAAHKRRGARRAVDGDVTAQAADRLFVHVCVHLHCYEGRRSSSQTTHCMRINPLDSRTPHLNYQNHLARRQDV